MPRPRRPAIPFRYFNSSPEIIRLAVMMYARYPLSLRNVEDLLSERGIDISHETVRHWWNRFGPLFAADVQRQRVRYMRGFMHWRWHLDEMVVRFNGEYVYLWRAVDHEGVLSCGLDADKRGQVRLDQQTLKLFLSGCARFAESYHIEPAAAAAIFSRVVGSAPQFQPAWRKLLLADTLVTRIARLFQDRFSPGRLPQDIVAARKLNPKIPEIYVAETELQPLNAYAKRLELLDHAVQLDPDNPDVLISRSVHLDAVGRIDEEFNDANRAVEIDPLSPGLRAILIASLTNAGKVSAAEDQLRQADALWPGAQAIDDARLRLNTRYGDAKAALNALTSDTKRRQNYSPSMEAFLTARIDPTPSNIQRAIDAASGPHLTDSNTLVQLMQMLGQFHRENALYDVLLHWRRTDVLGSVSQVYFRAMLHKFRQDPRFMIVAYRAGLVSYWRKSGKWPDFCSEPDLPYDCKQEAAKFAA